MHWFHHVFYSVTLKIISTEWTIWINIQTFSLHFCIQYSYLIKKKTDETPDPGIKIVAAQIWPTPDMFI